MTRKRVPNKKEHIDRIGGIWYLYQPAIQQIVSKMPNNSPVAQSVEQVAVNHPVAGSSPARGATI